MRHWRRNVEWLRLWSARAGAVLSMGLPAALAADFTVTTPGGISAYTVNGTGSNPTLTLVRGQTYTFLINVSSSHPFIINSSGVVNDDITSGTITYTVPTNAANYTYRCSKHGFGGNVITIPPPRPPTVQIVSLSVSTNIILRSTGTNTWSVFPEYNTNLSSTQWLALTVQTNTYASGTNETICGRPSGDSVFVRIRAQQN